MNAVDELLEKSCYIIDFLPEQVKPDAEGQFFDVQLVAETVNMIWDNHSGCLNVLLPDENVLVVFEGDSLNLSVYNPSEEIQPIMKKIAFSEGLFWRKSEINCL